MAHMRRMLSVAVVLMALTAVGGCFFLDGQFAMQQDGAVDARIEAGVLRAMAQEDDIAAELDEGIAEGQWTKQEPFDRDQWRVTALTGRAEPGESLFEEDVDPKPDFSMTSHLLSTVYSFRMDLPDEAVELEPPDEQAAVEDAAPAPENGFGDDGEVDVEGMEGLGEAFGEMMAAMMQGPDTGIRFAVELPGEIYATNGEVSRNEWRVTWSMDLTDQEQQFTQLDAFSRLPNWEQIGRLGAALTDFGRWDLVPALASGVQRGVLPDPVVADPAAAEMNVLMYVQALEILTALDRAVGPEIADEVIAGLELKGDPDPARVEEIAVRLEGIDLGAETSQKIIEQLMQMLGG